MDLQSVFVLGVIGVAFLVILSWVLIGARMWRQRERNAFADKLARDDVPPKGPFAVYLRAFKHPAYVAIDMNLGEQMKTLIVSRHTGTDGRSGTRPLESVLADILDKEMPLVGLGRPNAGLNKSGAGLVRTTDDEWQKVVTSLLDRCSLIVMTPAGTKGTAWEIEQLGVKPEWSEKTIYFMPNFQVELIRALQPFVMGHEMMFGLSRFVPPKVGKPKPPGSIIVHSLGLIVRAFAGLLLAVVRFYADLAFVAVLLFQRFAQTIGLRSRWGKARQAGRRHGLAFPGYTAKGRIFTLDEHGKSHKLADLHDIATDHLRNEVLKFAREAEKRRQRRVAAAEAASAAAAIAAAATAAIAPAATETALAEAEHAPPAEVSEITDAAHDADAAAHAESAFQEDAATPADAPSPFGDAPSAPIEDVAAQASPFGEAAPEPEQRSA